MDYCALLCARVNNKTDPRKSDFVYIYIKRALDILFSAIALIITSPVMLLVAILVKATSEGPVIFKQTRLGMNGKEFTMYKFRSMCVGAEKSGVYSDSKDMRVTKVGRVIRATSLDELPQLVNILKGEMSFVGPRPPLTYHPWRFSEYTAEQRKMFDVRPGITGWAQVNGRKDVEWHHRIELNCWYVENISLLLDIKIMFMTVFKVLKNEGNENKGATVEAKPEVKAEERTEEKV